MLRDVAVENEQAFSDELARQFSEIVFVDDETRTFYSNDIFWQPGVKPLAVAKPRNQLEAQQIVQLAGRYNVAIVPRGAGMSYSKGYLPRDERAIVIDCKGLNRIVEVNVDDMYIVAEVGCTWDEVNKALEGTGLRTGYWGPWSGIRATVGGALSQNSMMFGAAIHGAVMESVLSVSVLLSTGEVVTTGSGGRPGYKPFSRTGGPDLTGIFIGDNGAMGLKMQASLRLLPKPKLFECLSFGFRELEHMAAAHVELARHRLISEGFGIDKAKVLNSASVNRLGDAAKTLGSLAKSGKSLIGGLKDAAAVAVGGTDFLKEHNYTLHVVTEANYSEELFRKAEDIRAICTGSGVEILNSVPKVMRAQPFSSVRGMLGANGERWVPIHALFPLGDWKKVLQGNERFFDERKAWMDEHGIIYSMMICTVGNEFFLEPAFYWNDEVTKLHEVSVGSDIVKPWMNRPANEKARQAVVQLRADTQALYASLGGVSYQIARDYPYKSLLRPEGWELLEGIKRLVDPKGLMNPGSLGLANDR